MKSIDIYRISLTIFYYCIVHFCTVLCSTVFCQLVTINGLLLLLVIITVEKRAYCSNRRFTLVGGLSCFTMQQAAYHFLPIFFHINGTVPIMLAL